ncbi:hypothetical protein FRC17_001793 [Serendipita sp. 399]|nr:hypothetical protein FRC17_001793 [Serendipita sp. 399]
MSQWTAENMIPMDGQIVIVTGGNSGIGYVACKLLLKSGAKTYVMSRDSQKSQEAIKRMKEETGKESVELIPIDLSDLHSVRKAAKIFLSKESKLDVLMNNAGIMMTPTKELTKDGYDLQFGVNVLAHFHLTNLLLPALLAAPAPRVVNVSSDAHRWAFWGGIDWSTLKGSKKGRSISLFDNISSIRLYGQSKLGNIYHTNELARRYGERGLVAISVHPGLIASDLSRNLGFLSRQFMNLTGYPPTTGALTQVYAANSPEAQKLSGKFLVPVARVGNPYAIAKNEEYAKQMWEWCENELKAF